MCTYKEKQDHDKVDVHTEAYLGKRRRNAQKGDKKRQRNKGDEVETNLDCDH